MNKKDLAKRISKKTIFSQKEALLAIEAVFEEIVEVISEDEEIGVVGFGKFVPYRHKPRPVRNPKTQEEMLLDPCRTIRFRLSNVLREKLKEKPE